MLDANNIIEVIKKAAVDAVNAAVPCDVCMGTVTGTNPFRVFVEQKMILSTGQLIVTGTALNCKTGDRVLLIRKGGGQKYIVIDKAVSV